MAHFAKVIDREIRPVHNDRTVAKNVGVDVIEFTFDAEWAECTSKVAVFKNGPKEFRAAIDDDAVEVPWEVLDTPGDLYLSVIGYVGEDKRIVTENMARPYRVREAGLLAGSKPTDPTPDAVQVLLSRAGTATDAANGAAARAEAAQEAAVSGEAARSAAEEARQSAEDARSGAEAARVQAEASRASSESLRASAEASRATAEASRVSAESARVAAETSRSTAEAARVAEFDQMRQDFQGMQCILLGTGEYDPDTSQPTVDGDPAYIYYVPNPRQTVGDLYLEWRYLAVSDGSYIWELMGGRDKLPDAVTVADIDAIAAGGTVPKAERYLSLSGLAYLWAVVKEWFAAKVHKHDAADIETGEVPVAHGGTGASTALAAQHNLLGDMAAAEAVTDVDLQFVLARPDGGSETAGAVFRAAGSLIWNWLDAKIRSTFHFNASHQLETAGLADGAVTNAKLDQTLRDSLSRDTLIAYQTATDLNDVISGVVIYDPETNNIPKENSYGVCVVVVNTVDPTVTHKWITQLSFPTTGYPSWRRKVNAGAWGDWLPFS
ncbi:hypothetical protein [uncultured Adlercreutzia sp.]|uniref:hypothetical protein n=1 Tax=uncultured Adlercreutzia sp. TaxID=875803 RepID=UPI002589CE6D|nr:hypothetical protein [uncultured Adlercreutzia sp.]